MVSTDDNEKIAEIAIKLGVKVPFIRPSSLSGDKTPTSAACLHALNFYEKNYYKVDAILLLQPTSPFDYFLFF